MVDFGSVDLYRIRRDLQYHNLQQRTQEGPTVTYSTATSPVGRDQ